MGTYDDLEGFIKYTDKNEWKKYIENYLLPLWKATFILKDYFNRLREFDNLSFNEVKEKDKDLLLGGIRPGSEEMYPRNSLAGFYLQFFGLRLTDIKSWVYQQQFGEELTDITVKVEETEFIKFVKEVFDLIENALHYQTLVTNPEEPKLNYEELKENPEGVKNIIKEFYQALLNLIVNYNYWTFFICSINQVTYRWIKSAYPRIDEILEFLQNEFGLIEFIWNNPIKPETESFREYTIFCFPEYNPNNLGKSFGGAICKLNEQVWKNFSYSSNLKNTLSILFGSIPDFKGEFKEKIKTQLPEKFHPAICYKGILASESSSNIEKSNKNIMNMLDENMPFLFTNLIKINGIYKDIITFG